MMFKSKKLTRGIPFSFFLPRNLMSYTGSIYETGLLEVQKSTKEG